MVEVNASGGGDVGKRGQDLGLQMTVVYQQQQGNDKAQAYRSKDQHARVSPPLDPARPVAFPGRERASSL